MKKTLLFFLLLFTTIFYAQVSDIEHCAGDTSFNLTSQKTLLIGNLDPALTTVSYHLSLTDAQNNLNAIASPTNYVSSASSTTIYARIDNNGAVSTNYFNLKVYEQLNALYTATSISCNGANNGTAHIILSGGKAPYIYSLDGGPFISYAGTSVVVFTNLSPGSHRIQVKDALGCATPFYMVVITEPAILSATVSIQNQNVIIVTASGGVGQYQYSLNGGTYQTSNVFSNLSPGTYFVKVKDSQGCEKSLPVTTILPPLMAAASIVKQIDCNSNATINLVATGGKAPYTFSINGGAYQANTVLTDLVAGSYNIAVKDALNNISNSYNITIEQPVLLTATIIAPQVKDCSTNSATYISITGVGGKSPYQYSINNYNYQSSGSYGGVYPGNHIIKVKDANGCVYTTPLVITSPSSLLATATVNKATECGKKDSVTITATGGQAPYTYSFTGGVSFIDSDTSTDLTVGNYTVFAKDSNGCKYTTYVTVEQSLLSATTTTDVYNKTIKVNVTGGKAPYKYALKKNSEIIIGSQNENIFNNVAFGSYVVDVTDANGCIVSSNIELYSPLIVSAVITNPVSSENYGKIEVNATGGLAPYKYSINSGGYTSNNVFTNLVQGVYQVEVRDSSNNISSLYVVIEPLSPLTATTINTDVNCFGSNDGTIVANASGGLAPYTYSLYNNETQIIPYSSASSFSNLPAGSYKVRVNDSSGYTYVSNNIFITEPTFLISTVTVENQTITVNATGGNGIYNYSNGNGYQTSNIFTNVSFGNYQIYVKDQNGCVVLSYVTVDPPAPLIDDKNTLTIEFTPGQTLGDLIVNGQNIKWYSTKTTPTAKTGKAAETTLPSTTALVNGTTYYASQTINGIESKERLAVTAKAKGTLSTPDFVLPDFKYYPNPVQHTLTINNSAAIDEIEIFSVSGKSILTKKINNTNSEIDLSNLSSGFYFLKVKAEGQTKTIKIVKK